MHDAQIRARLMRGYEDSIVNLLFFGTRFTRLPRLTADDIDALPERRSVLLEGRLDDLIAAVGSPGTNGQLLFVRSMMERHGANPATADGRRDAREYVVSLMNRFAADRSRYDRTYRSATQSDDPSETLFTQSTLYRDRGLSSDTSIFPDEQFDVVVATNILVYYDIFDQSLALQNVADAAARRPLPRLITSCCRRRP